ncbi:putative Phosphatase and actin regulator protein [Naja naja]|nr:putative Phosphatase and actin regulator protein [Naja naja]
MGGSFRGGEREGRSRRQRRCWPEQSLGLTDNFFVGGGVDFGRQGQPLGCIHDQVSYGASALCCDASCNRVTPCFCVLPERVASSFPSAVGGEGFLLLSVRLVVDWEKEFLTNFGYNEDFLGGVF